MKITIVPTAGLCNRMNVIINTFSFYEIMKHPMDIYWDGSKNECKAKFHDLFLPIIHPDITIHDEVDFVNQPAGKRNLYIPKLLRKFVYKKQYQNVYFDNEIEEVKSTKKDIYITAYNSYVHLPKIKDIGNLFKPTIEIEERILKVTSQFSPNTIGVHIRRTDNSLSIKNSPIESFEKMMEHEIDQDPECKFYLASDDEKVKLHFIKKYGERIITHRWELKRNTLNGMKDAVAELYCLARTSKIIGSLNSTYTFMAHNLYNAPLVNSEKIKRMYYEGK